MFKQTLNFDINKINTMICWSDFYDQVGVTKFIDDEIEKQKKVGMKPIFNVSYIYMNKSDEDKLYEIRERTWKEYNIHFKEKQKKYVITSKRKTPLKKVDYYTERSFPWDSLNWGPNVSRGGAKEGEIILEWKIVDINEKI